MQSSRKHIHMRCVIQPHRHINTSSMKTTSDQHEDTIKHHINHCFAHVLNPILCPRNSSPLVLSPQCFAKGNAGPKVKTTMYKHKTFQLS
jgi:hypothetical protein